MLVRATLACLFGWMLFAQPAGKSSLDAAAKAYGEGKLDVAEQILETLLKTEPEDPGALVMMGVVLDAEQRYQEAEAYYRRALKVAPSAYQVLNNAANHYLTMGNRDRARDLYLRTLAIDPHQANANLQLAQMCIDDKQAQQAISYLEHIAGTDPDVELLRARALALTGRCRESSDLLEKIGKPAGNASVYYSIGMAQAECKRFDNAEESFSRALDADPRNFDILYNLGLAALRAGHVERAQSVLETALHEKPDDADTLLALAQVFEKRHQLIACTELLTRAEKVSPDRADVVLLLAQVSAGLEFFEDSAAAYDRYLKLRPHDDVARRERGFELARANRLDSARQDLEWYTGRHPKDAVGYFEFAVARLFENRDAALALLDRAITLDPSLYQARYTRARLNIEDGRPAEAIPDLKLFLEKEPKNVEALARLGQAYLAANRPSDALEVLDRARALAPDSVLVMLHYYRTLIKLGRRQEAAAVLVRLRSSGNREDTRRHVGLIDYLSLSPEDRRARRLANLQHNSAADPGNFPLKIILIRELIADGRGDEGIKLLHEMQPADLSPALQAQCGRILLGLERFEDARTFLERALAAAPGLREARLDLAIALFRLHDSAGALRTLDAEPAVASQGDYCLVRAQILDAQGKIQEAAAALNQGMHAAPTRAALYYQATSFLLKHKLYHQAQSLLEEASRILPDDRELMLAQVVTLNLLQRDADSQRLLAKIQARWPEWERPYLLKGILLESKLSSAEARQALETAIALGSNAPEAYYYDALAISHSAPEELDAAQKAIERALALTSKDPYIYLLAGRISLERKEYAAAVDRLQRAIQLQPGLIPAHYALREAYTDIGDQTRAREEVEAIKHIAARTGGNEISESSMEDVLFTVRPPE